ncbi:MAG: YbgA family protein [Planctomycetota bacterium]|jgi:uncharacterized protein YbgA (DUF1722 family)/uncharacterized protein YbbK (DUF523 family)
MTQLQNDAAGAREPGPSEIRLGVSACLLGQPVRVDGGHKRNRFLVEELGPYVTWVPVCPEVEIGLGTPRPALRLVRGEVDPNRPSGRAPPRLVGSKNGDDVTARMETWGEKRLPELASAGLHGFVFKKDSPTCGLFRVRVYDENGAPSKDGRGLWADAFARRFPLLPAEEEGRLNDPHLRENFITRVFTYARWCRLRASDPAPPDLVRFHTAHKMLLLTHSPRRYREMGPLVAEAGTRPWEELLDAYGLRLMETLAERPSRGRNLDALQHLAGFLKKDLGSEEKQELARVFRQYREGLVPLVVPITLLRHLLRTRTRHPWVDEQLFLAPYPESLMLRNVI